MEKTLTIKINEADIEMLTVLSKNKKKSLESFVSSLVEDFVKREREIAAEDAEDYKEAESAWNEFVASGERTYTLDEAKAEFGL